jgi:DNA-binding transcriptional LysR family regulator
VDVDVRLLRYLLAVEAERSFTAAAAALGVSQPALSQGVRRLEEAVGSRLVVRGARGVPRDGSALTPAGASLCADARAITEHLDRALARARRLAADAERTRLTVGIGTSTPRRVSTGLLQALHEQPDLEVVFRHVPWGQEREHLRDGRVDLVFLHVPDAAAVPPAAAVVALVERVAVFCADHPLAGRASVSVEDLAEEPILDAGSDRATWLVEPRPGARTPPVVGPAVHTVEEMLALVAAGRGMAITSSAVAEGHRTPDLAFVPLTGLPPLALVLLASEEDTRSAVAAVLDALPAPRCPA